MGIVNEKSKVKKKLYNGCVSIRDYIVQDCIKKEKGIVVQYRHWKMTIPFPQLKEFFQFHSQKFKSKYNSKTYQLFDMQFIPDEMTNETYSIK